MSDREFYILLKRGLSIMANDPSVGQVQRRGLQVMIEALERRLKQEAAPSRQPKRDVVQSVT